MKTARPETGQTAIAETKHSRDVRHLRVRLQLPTMPHDYQEACAAGYLPKRRHRYSTDCPCRRWSA